MLGVDRRAAECEPGDDVRLRLAGSLRPGTFLLLRGGAPGRPHAVCERLLLEDDDPAPAELRRGPVAQQALPAGGPGDRRGLVRPGRTTDEERSRDGERSR